MAKALYSFRGGIRLEQMEEATTLHSRPLPVPASAVVPLTLSDGTLLRALCRVGDTVFVGQPVAQAEDGFAFSAPVSGTVAELLPGNGGIRIASDGRQTPFAGCVPHSKKLSETSSEEIIAVIRSAGILMPDGSGKPLYRVLAGMPNTVSRVILNATECEPGLSACDTLLCEHPNAVVDGLKILMKALSVSRGDIALEDRREQAVNAVLSCVGDSDYLTVRIMEAKYPLSRRRVLFKALTGNDIPRGDRPENYGFTVFSAETCAQVYRRFATGMPAVGRFVTVGGDAIENPGVYSVPFGTALTDLLSLCGGRKENSTLIAGGLLSGKKTEEAGVIGPASAAYFCVPDAEIPRQTVSHCTHCGLCFDACPAKIYPGSFIDGIKRRKDLKSLRPALEACLGCGACTFVCPSKIPIASRMAAARRTLPEDTGKERNHG